VPRKAMEKMKKFNECCQKIEEATIAPRVGWAAKCCRNKFQTTCGAMLGAHTSWVSWSCRMTCRRICRRICQIANMRSVPLSDASLFDGLVVLRKMILLTTN